MGEAALPAVVECLSTLADPAAAALGEAAFVAQACAALTADGTISSAVVRWDGCGTGPPSDSMGGPVAAAFAVSPVSGGHGTLEIVPGPGVELDSQSRRLLEAVGRSIAVGLDSLRGRADRLWLEQVVSESEQRYWRLVEGTPEPIVVTVDGILVYANPAAQRLAGVDDPQQIVGRAALEFVHPLCREGAGERMRLLDQGMQAEPRAEVVVTRPDGSTIEVESTSVPCMFGGKQAVQSVLRDLSEEKQRQQALQESEERYRTIIETAHDMVWILDREGRFSYANARSGEVVGHQVSEWIGRSFTPLVVAEDLGPVLDRFHQVIAGRPLSDEFRVVAHDGRHLTLSVNTAPLTRGGEVVGAVSFARDVTEQRLLESRLLRAQKMENLGRLAGGVAHDFNNLLAAIQGYSELLLASPDLPPHLAVDAQEVKDAAGRGVALTRQLLAFSRRQALRPAVLSLNRVVDGMEGLLRRVLREDVTLVLDLEPALWQIVADTGQLEQVLMNLVVNARDAMPQGGRLLVTTSNHVVLAGDELTHLEVSPGAYAVLTVEDTGSGMDPETLSLAFEPFFTTKGVGRGTGLGLSTVYGVVEQSGGGIRVDSAPGEGTTFRLFFPRAAVDTGATVAPVADDRDGELAGCETVLLVEDDRTVRDLVRRILRGLGYAVLEAATAEDALSVALGSADPVDLVLTDVVLPGMNGRELVDVLYGRYGELPAVLMSGYAADVLIADSLASEAVNPAISFIEKPFSPNALARLVRRALDGAAAS